VLRGFRSGYEAVAGILFEVKEVTMLSALWNGY